MELTVRYGLEFNPFLKNSKEILYTSSEYKEALFRLDYLSRTKGSGCSPDHPGGARPPLSETGQHRLTVHFTKWFTQACLQ